MLITSNVSASAYVIIDLLASFHIDGLQMILLNYENHCHQHQGCFAALPEKLLLYEFHSIESNTTQNIYSQLFHFFLAFKFRFTVQCCQFWI